MRLVRPLYEILPLLYVLIGGAAFLLAAVDPESVRAMLADAIGFFAEIAALTVFLRRQDYRAQSREYSGESIDFPTSLKG